MAGEVYAGCTHTPPHEHGQTRTYRGPHRCRCEDCRAVHVAAQRERRAEVREKRRAANPAPPRLVPVEVVTEHLRALRASGLALTRIAERTGMDERYLFHLLDPARAAEVKGRPCAHVTVATRDRILAVQPARYVHEVSGRARVPSVGTIRRLNALQALGWPSAALAREAGLSSGAMTEIRTQEWVKVSTAAAVARTYDRLWNRLPPDDTPQARSAITKALRRANAEGWLPPLAWDDHQLDDPAAQPHDWRPRSGRRRTRARVG